MASRLPLQLLLLLDVAAASASGSETAHFLGVNYLRLGDDLPPPHRALELGSSAGAAAVRFYDSNATFLSPAAASGLVFVPGVPNELIIPSLAASQRAADHWVASTLLPFRRNAASATSSSATRYRALRRHGMRRVKVTTTLVMDALDGRNVFPPSAGVFRPDIADAVVLPLLDFLERTDSYLFVDAYTYFTWSANHTIVPLHYALLEPAPAPALGYQYHDPGTGLSYRLHQPPRPHARRGGRRHLPRRPLRRQAGPGRDRLAQRRRPRPVRRQRAERGNVQPQHGAAPGVRRRHAAAAGDAHAGVRVCAVQRGPQDGARHGAAPGPVPPQLQRGVRGRPDRTPPAGVVPAAAAGDERCAIPGEAVVRGEDERPRWGGERDGGEGDAACADEAALCAPLIAGGECYLPNTVAAHPSYVFSAHWNKFSKIYGGWCYFAGLAVETTADPSHGSCKFPSVTPS